MHILEQLMRDFENCLPVQSDAGLKGELLASYLLLMAKFALDFNRKELYSVPITVREYFTLLFGSESASLLDEETSNSFMAFNAVRRSQVRITNEVLFDAWSRRVILLCQLNTPAIDLVIPVVKGRKGCLEIEPNEQNISCIVVQIKYRSDPLYEGSQIRRSSTTAVTIGLNMTEMWIKTMKWQPVGIIMAVGQGGLARSCPEVLELEKFGVKIFTTDFERICGRLNIEPPILNHLRAMRDAPSGMFSGIKRQYFDFEADLIHEKWGQLIKSWSCILDDGSHVSKLASESSPSSVVDDAKSTALKEDCGTTSKRRKTKTAPSVKTDAMPPTRRGTSAKVLKTAKSGSFSSAAGGSKKA